MSDLTIEDLMKRALSGEMVDASSYTDALSALANPAPRADPMEDAALKKMVENQAAPSSGAVADSIEPVASQPLGARTDTAMKDAMLRRMLKDGEQPASRALAETMSDRVVPDTTGQGLLEPGNLDLTARPYVKNPDGSTSTVRSMGVNMDGKEYLIPTVSDDGRVMGDQEAIDYFRRTGKHMGVYSSPETSTQSAETIHLDQMAHPPRNTLAAGAPDPLASFAKTAVQGVAPEDAAATVPQAIKGVQGDLSADSLTKLATAQPAPGAPVTSGGLKERSPAEEEQRNQEARRALQAKGDREFLSGRADPGEAPIVGPLEKAFHEKYGEEYGGSKWAAAFSDEGTALYESRSKRWEDQRNAARAADQENFAKNRKISNAMAGLIMRTNPALRREDVVNLREGDPLVELMGQGGLGQDEKLRLELIRLKGTEIKTDSSEGTKALELATRMDIADKDRDAKAALAKKGGGGGGGARDREMREAVLARQLKDKGLPSTLELAKSLLDGTADLSQYNADVQNEMKLSAREIAKMSGKAFEGYQRTSTGRSPQLKAQLDTALERWRQNPEKKAKIKANLSDMQYDIQRARTAYDTLSPVAKTALAKIGGQSWLSGGISKLLTTERDQTARAELQTLLNALLKMRSGAAVTESEGARIYQEAGFPVGNFDALNSPETVKRFLLNVGNKYVLTKRAWESEYGPLIDAKGAK